jgi:hypothetical protein
MTDSTSLHNGTLADYINRCKEGMRYVVEYSRIDAHTTTDLSASGALVWTFYVATNDYDEAIGAHHDNIGDGDHSRIIDMESGEITRDSSLKIAYRGFEISECAIGSGAVFHLVRNDTWIRQCDSIKGAMNVADWLVSARMV